MSPYEIPRVFSEGSLTPRRGRPCSVGEVYELCGCQVLFFCSSLSSAQCHDATMPRCHTTCSILGNENRARIFRTGMAFVTG